MHYLKYYKCLILSLDSSDILIIIPSYNEGERIGRVVKMIRSKGFKNIIVIDDGSTDNSIDLIKEPDVTILTHLVNRGAGAATETGLKYCRDFLKVQTVVMIDADTQHDPDDINKLLAAHFS